MREHATDQVANLRERDFEVHGELRDGEIARNGLQPGRLRVWTECAQKKVLENRLKQRNRLVKIVYDINRGFKIYKKKLPTD